MEKLIYFSILTTSVICLSGCASITSIDVSGKDPLCVRECASKHSQCSTASSLSPIVLSQQCRDGYEVCIKTCNPK